MRDRNRIVLPLLVLLAFGASLPCWAEKAETPSQVVPFGVPRSDWLVEVEIQLPDGKVARVQGRDGALITIQDHAKGYFGALSPVMPDPRNRETDILIGEILEKNGELGIKQTTRFLAEMDEEKVFRLGPDSFKVTVLSSSLGSFPTTPTLAESLQELTAKQLVDTYGISNGSICCVTCGGRTICASWVELDCGSCGGAWVY